MNRKGERMQGFAHRALGREESEEDAWDREWEDAEQLPEAGFELFVTQVRWTLLLATSLFWVYSTLFDVDKFLAAPAHVTTKNLSALISN